MRTIIVLLSLCSVAIAEPFKSPAAVAASSPAKPALPPLKDLTREQALQLDAAMAHATAIEEHFAAETARAEAPWLATARALCKLGGFTLEELANRSVLLDVETGKTKRATAAIAPGATASSPPPAPAEPRVDPTKASAPPKEPKK